MDGADTAATSSAPAVSVRRGRIVRRYFLIFATLVGGMLIVSVLLEMWFRYEEARQSIEVAHRQMAELAALRIRNYVDEVVEAVHLAAQPRNLADGRVTADYIVDLRNLLKNVPSIRNALDIDPDGHEQLRVSRIGPSLPDTKADHRSDPAFAAALAGGTYFGPIIFPQNSFEPWIMLAVPIEPYRGDVVGVLAADVNVRYVWDVVQAIHIGQSGYAYVVSSGGTLVAHPDLHLVLQRTDMSRQPQVAVALQHPGNGDGGIGIYRNLNGQRVLVAHAAIPNLGWTVFVERPLTEVYGPLAASLARTGGVQLLFCIMTVAAAVILGRRVVRPIEVLRQGAARLEAEDLGARLNLKTGDEFEELADDFNRMAGRLQSAYAGLEQKVAERTQALEQSLDRIKGLGETIQAVSASLDLQKVLQTIVVHATELSRSDAGLIYEFDSAAQTLHFRAGHQLSPAFVDKIKTSPPTFNDSIIGRAVLNGAPVQMHDVSADASYAFKELILTAGYRALVGVPIIRSGRMLGGIVLARKMVGEYTNDEIKLLDTFANGSAIAIEHARLFHEVEQKNAALQLASQHKSAFLANTSHELRTPMNAILGFTDLLLDGIYGEVGRQLRTPIEQIHSNGQHLLQLINDILDLSKIEAGRIELNLGEYSADDVVAAAMTTAQPLAREKGLALNANVQKKIGPCYGDGKRMYQVLLNLVGNAVKFTHRGHVDVVVDAANGEVHYTVKDTGIGIPPEQLDAIFEEFGQGDPSVVKEFGGTGLGLAIAKRFVTMHGGRIWAESTPNVGSTFYAVVPQRVTLSGEPHA